MPTATARLAAAAFAALALAACGDDNKVTGANEPSIAAVRLTVTPNGGTPASTVVSLNTSGPQPVAVRVGTSTVTAQPLDASGNPVTLSDAFELRLASVVGSAAAADESPLTGVVSFTGQPGLLSGTLTASTSATVSAWVRLVHVARAHSDFDKQLSLTAAP